jgi:GcrA cell cycle regulator
MSYAWGDNLEVDLRLRELWIAGRSAGDIALELRRDFGVAVSRSAVIGRVHRIKLIKRKAIIAKAKPRAAPVVRLVQHSKPTSSPPLPPSTGSVSFMDLNDAVCRFPLNGDFYCGDHTEPHSSYCQYHHYLTHRVVNKMSSEV